MSSAILEPETPFETPSSQEPKDTQCPRPVFLDDEGLIGPIFTNPFGYE